jgi:hypothetical protein
MLFRRTPARSPRAHVRARATRLVAAALAALALDACADGTATAPRDEAGAPRTSIGAGGARTTVTRYDSRDLAEYQQKWSNAYGPLELAAGGTLAIAPGGGVTVSAEPFHVGADFSVYDHLKYIAVSNQSFAVPANGSLTLSAEITAATSGAVAGRVIHGCYGPAYSWDGVAPCAQPWSQAALQGQQAGVVLNMINFATGQLFDWFVSGTEVFALIERLPSNVTGSPGVGLDKAYTQIIRAATVPAGGTHAVAITYTRAGGTSSVEYFLDGKSFARVENVGVPLDVQRVPYTGIYPSLGAGEPVAALAESFVFGHGLFSLLDAYPFQHPDRPDLSVSVPMTERLFGQGATGTWRKFTAVQVAQ